ncbi:MAG: methylmalonyl Co-A mutase-associated GTPase MeaB [Dehalococcoidia bacterium]
MPAGGSSASGTAAELVERLLAGDRRALARVISYVEDATAEGQESLRLLYPRTGRAHTIGITGSAGSGKSTLVWALTRELRSRGRTVGIVAVDPSSAFTQGALLGDRIRMQDLTADREVFVRSMASRGFVGGLAVNTSEVVAVLDAAGKEVVLIETVGAGQDEIDIASAAQTTVVVNTPGGGDEIQTMKAGLLEVADVLVVNKADLEGAEAVSLQLAAVFSLAPPPALPVPIVKTVATTGEGVEKLADAVEGHRRLLEESQGLEQHYLAQARRQVLAAARHLLTETLSEGGAEKRLDELVWAVAARKMDPRSAAERLVGRTDG